MDMNNDTKKVEIPWHDMTIPTMQLCKIAFATLLLLTLSGIARADSVTRPDFGPVETKWEPSPGLQLGIYGVMDVGISHASDEGGKSNTYFQDGVLQGNRLGITADMTVDDDTSAIFRLESGYSMGTGASGQSGTLWGRNAYVGLASKTWGSMTAGRQYDFSWDLARVTLGSKIGPFSFLPGDYDNQSGDLRINNSIKYYSPLFDGFQFGALHGFGQTAGDFKKNSTDSMGASYANGAFTVMAAYTLFHNLVIDPKNSLGVQTFLGEPLTGTIATDSVKNTALAASYNFGSFELQGLTNTTQFNAAGQSADLDTNAITGMYSFTPQLKFGTGYYKSRMDAFTWTKVPAVIDYRINKWVDIYAMAVNIKVSGPGIVATSYLVSPLANGQSLTLYRFGTRFRF
jgi:predicted porin